MQNTEQTERAWRAVKRFRSLLPSFESFARSFTGNDNVRVVMGVNQGSFSTKDTITVTPPLTLGDTIQHVRMDCEKRDRVTRMMVCEACAVHDNLMWRVFHEIAHISFDSFAPFSYREVVELAATVRKAYKQWPKYAAKAEKGVRSKGSNDANMFGLLCMEVHPYLHFIVNAIEDARIDKMITEARAGIRPTMEAFHYRNLYMDSDEQLGSNSQHLAWDEQELDGQIMILFYYYAVDIDVRNIFSAEAQAVFEDERVRELADESRASSSIYETVIIGTKLLARLNEMGYLNPPPDETVPPPPQPAEPEKGDDADDETTEQDSTESDEPDRSDDPSDSGDNGGDPGDSEGKPDSTDNESDDEDDNESASSEPDESEGETDSGQGDTDSSEDEESSSDSEEDDSLQEEGTDSSEGDRDTSESTQDGRDNSPDGSSSEEQRPGEQDDTDSCVDGDGESPGEEAQDSKSEGITNTSGEEASRPPSDPEAVGKLIKQIQALMGHGDVDEPDHEHGVPEQFFEQDGDAEAIAIAIIQEGFFEGPSETVTGIQIYTDPNDFSKAWMNNDYKVKRIAQQMQVVEKDISQATLKLRIAFFENAAGRKHSNLKSGKINARVLGRRAPTADPRLFTRQTVPGKRDYHVIVALDASGSTEGRRSLLIKQIGMTLGEMCSRLRVPFELWGHTASLSRTSWTQPLDVDMIQIKSSSDHWDGKTKDRLARMGNGGANLDGHAMEFLRKRADRSTATDTVIIYVTDGDMPQYNGREELRILKDELVTIRRKGYHLAGAGVFTDSPTKHGLPTARVDRPSDIIHVVQLLEKLLSKPL